MVDEAAGEVHDTTIATFACRLIIYEVFTISLDTFYFQSSTLGDVDVLADGDSAERPNFAEGLRGMEMSMALIVAFIVLVFALGAFLPANHDVKFFR